MRDLAQTPEVVDPGLVQRSARRLGAAGIVLPTFAQLADPATIPAEMVARLAAVDPDAPDPANLFRVHWHNAADRRSVAAVPEYLVLPKALTGVDAPIVVALGDRFPMIGAHKVLAAYACLAPRLVTGEFDPERHRAVWPSTGNYCRGGVAISRILGCRGVAVLPEGMSQERFDWLADWVAAPEDVIKTPGTESNVKEIYDRCAELSADPANWIFNQFSEYANHLVHALVTGPALGRVAADLRRTRPDLRVHAFVSATGSAGTIAAGDYLKEEEGARIVAVEALECPTLLDNGFGEHNIQGIGDKHVPLIHNVMNTDTVVAISDRSTDAMNVVFNTYAGQQWLIDRRGVEPALVEALSAFGLSSICNVLAAIRVARAHGLGPDDAILTVATDGARMYATERAKAERRDFGGSLDETAAAEAFGEHVLGGGGARLRDLDDGERTRIFNLGYFTWVEQQGVSIEAFTARRTQAFWHGLRDLVPAWDALIDEFNAVARQPAGVA